MVTVEELIEATIRPVKCLTNTVAEITVLTDGIEVSFPEKREDFWRVIKKELGYRWAGSCWHRILKPINGLPIDRAAEAGHKLLASGFSIRIFDAEIRQKVLSVDYIPECTRWIKGTISGKYQGWFAVVWSEYNDNLYKAARKLPGSKYSDHSVYVPAEQFEEILDFAGMYGFKFSDAAKEIVNQARRIKEASLVVCVDATEDKQPPVPGDKPKKLVVPEKVEVSDEFKD